jgi:hypothetical protein
MTFLTPLGALVAATAVVVLAVWAIGRRRVGVVRRSLGLAPPAGKHDLRVAALIAALATLGLAAAQPALTHESRVRARSDAEALFVVDTSRSMQASTKPTSPTRLGRALAAAVRLRGSIADVPSGIATLTDRVLPDLLPVPDTGSFDAVAARAVAIESPPPRETSVRATTFAALGGIASGNYFAPGTTRRLVVLLTDGESAPIDPGAIARALAPSRGYRFIAVRFWQEREAVYDADGKAERAYRPDPTGGTLLDGLASAVGGRAFDESGLGAARAYLSRVAGSGPSTVTRGVTVSRQPLAPYLAAASLLLLAVSLVPPSSRRIAAVIESEAR